jgi:hypothetical protein
MHARWQFALLFLLLGLFPAIIITVGVMIVVALAAVLFGAGHALEFLTIPILLVVHLALLVGAFLLGLRIGSSHEQKGPPWWLWVVAALFALIYAGVVYPFFVPIWVYPMP